MPVARTISEALMLARVFAAACCSLGILVSISCGPTRPSGSAAGDWFALGIGHSQVFYLTLQQQGERISGVACGSDGGVLLFADAPVSGSYPIIGFVVTSQSAGACCAYLAGVRFSGKLDDTGDIVGRWGETDLRFKRSDVGRCGP
jgi:hypothetical protein